MTSHDYILEQARELVKLHNKKARINEQLEKGNTVKRENLLLADLGWTCMHIGQTEERIAFALGYIRPDEARAEWQPTAWQKYPGIGAELEQIEFE